MFEHDYTRRFNYLVRFCPVLRIIVNGAATKTDNDVLYWQRQ